MLESNFAISELQRKLANIVRIGVVKEVDYEKAKVRVKIGELLTDFLPWITSRAGEERSWLPPSINEQVVILSPLGELSLGVVLAGIYQQNYSAPENSEMINSLVFQDGTKLLYDKESKNLEISVVDKLNFKVGKSEIEMTKSGIKLKAERIDLN
ncbi:MULTISPECIES: phage baseplate assembly protein V [unclassified Wolbachia]|uniref:phage baseplate assembly protein V n=2 Tax=Wolbachia TaxID=953 RepID=UPI00064A0C32|nr:MULTISPECIES: phage baseplate assembly protein V [unclassified Wolbachia]KLT22147.1 baseplate assembly protein GpV [Wolbachia endosymbiont of Armadillidium vulgare str. wVulC]MCA7010448.1 phage baseplate assembly protein V [Wolbachia endosymbiont of Tribolium confusum]MDV6249285.1 phage baseplate assembly protein V [Wolbachia endosymbiont of Zaprionus taronus]QVU16062.1 Baseplate assembly protein GpV [Wolbachia endosymbiont of Drosophila yakuba]QVU16222.1 Baseplate assembly protein GpV [Wol